MRRVAVFLLLIASATINVVQWRRTVRLGQTLEAADVLEGYAVGEHVPVTTGRSNNGDSTVVVPPHSTRQRILYWTSPRCPWSARNEGNFLALSRHAQATFDIVVIVAEDAQGPLSSSGRFATIPVRLPAHEAQSKLRLRETPTTIVLDGDRKALHTWKGAYFGRIGREVEEFFGLVLPEQSPSASTTDAANQER